MNPQPSDVFLSEEDLDLQNLSDEELTAVYEAWLRAAALTDEEDKHLYSHGVFLTEPGYSHLAPQLVPASRVTPPSPPVTSTFFTEN